MKLFVAVLLFSKREYIRIFTVALRAPDVVKLRPLRQEI
jgi:hypothetical protein